MELFDNCLLNAFSVFGVSVVWNEGVWGYEI